MAVLYYMIDDRHIPIESGKLKVIDSITTKFNTYEDIYKRYSNDIGLYLYDNDIDDININKKSFKLQYTITATDRRILEAKIPLNLDNNSNISINILLKNKTSLLDENNLYNELINYNPKLKKYLSSIIIKELYYNYLRILLSYYENKDIPKQLTKSK